MLEKQAERLGRAIGRPIGYAAAIVVYGVAMICPPFKRWLIAKLGIKESYDVDS